MSIVNLIEAVAGTGIVATSITYLWTRKKYLAEVKTNDLENLRRMLDLYIDIVEDNKKRLDDYQSQLEIANNKVVALTDEIVSLRQEVKELRIENNDLRNKLPIKL